MVARCSARDVARRWALFRQAAVAAAVVMAAAAAASVMMMGAAVATASRAAQGSRSWPPRRPWIRHATGRGAVAAWLTRTRRRAVAAPLEVARAAVGEPAQHAPALRARVVWDQLSAWRPSWHPRVTVPVAVQSLPHLCSVAPWSASLEALAVQLAPPQPQETGRPRKLRRELDCPAGCLCHESWTGWPAGIVFRRIRGVVHCADRGSRLCRPLGCPIPR